MEGEGEEEGGDGDDDDEPSELLVVPVVVQLYLELQLVTQLFNEDILFRDGHLPVTVRLFVLLVPTRRVDLRWF